MSEENKMERKYFGLEVGQSTPLMACWYNEENKKVEVPMMLDRLEDNNILTVGLKIEENSEERKVLDDFDKSKVLEFLEENKKDLQEIFKMPEEYTIKYYQDEEEKLE